MTYIPVLPSYRRKNTPLPYREQGIVLHVMEDPLRHPTCLTDDDLLRLGILALCLLLSGGDGQRIGGLPCPVPSGGRNGVGLLTDTIPGFLRDEGCCLSPAVKVSAEHRSGRP
jgi:hypothetical protein